MTHRADEDMPRPSSGARTVRLSLIFGAITVAPILIYSTVGPADGNPIGLGLLAVFGLPVAALGVLVGVVRQLVDGLGSRDS